MNCHNCCGEKNIEEAKSCVDCGKPMQGTPPTEPQGYESSEPQSSPPPIDNHLVWAILATIFCCLPFGIVSIVYAAQVNSLVAEGKFDSARQASENAKMWAWIAFGVGIFLSWPAWFVWIGAYAILGPIGIILLVLPALVALAIWLYVRNSTKGK